MKRIKINDLPEKDLVPGYTGKYLHGENITMGWVYAKEGYTIPIHSHPHEQISFVSEGKLLFILEGVDHILEAGMAITIPPNAKHGATAITDCKLIDVFNPVREDYKVEI